MSRVQHPLHLAGGIVCVIVTVVAIGWALIYGATLTPIQQLVILVFLPVLPVMALYLGSSAVASGQAAGVNFKVGGMMAAYVIVFILLKVLMPAPLTKVVRILIRDQGMQITQPFLATLQVPNSDPIRRTGDMGEASVEVSSALAVIASLTVDCKGYVIATRENEPIPDDGIVRVELERATSKPPSPPTNDPAPSAMQNRATQIQAESLPKTDPRKVTLHYRNSSGEELTLMLLDWSRHYRFSRNEETAGASPWLDFPMEARDEFTAFNNFRNGSGWFSVCIRQKDGPTHELALVNLFDVVETWLTVDKKGDTFNLILDRNKP